MPGRIVILALMALFSTALFAQTAVERAKSDELVFMADDEPAMKKAFAQARATLDEFLRKAKAPPAGTFGYALKVGIRDGDDVEYFWVGDFAQTGRGFVGTIDNEPRMVKTVRYGQRYSFPRADIVDWTYIDKKARRMMGNFTVCALLTKEPPAEAEETRKRFGLRCE